MNEFIRCNKRRGAYWLKIPIDNIKIRVKLKAQGTILALPKFEDYSNGEKKFNLENTVDEYIFKWQEKRFSIWEFKHYGDVLNCITDLDITYNDLIKSGYVGQKVFSYIHDESYLPLPSHKQKKTVCKSWIDKINVGVQTIFLNNSISMQHLFRSENNICEDEEQWTAMHIVFDNSTYNEDLQLLMKQEIILLSLFYNKTKQYLVISPDSNDLEMNPYSIELDNGTVLDYHYSIDVVTNELDDDDGNSEELMSLLKKLYDKCMKKQKNLIHFSMPAIGKKLFYITLEIVTATNFEMDNVYIEYNIKPPEGVICKKSLKGRTHVSEALTSEEVSTWNFGHLIELSLEIDKEYEPKPLKVFFEAISTDWWDRHRTEGYTHVSVPLLPGGKSKALACLRPEEFDTVEAENRRFFLGGCHLLKDLDVLVQPDMDPSVIYKSTGSISIRWSTICQSSTPRHVKWPTSGTGDASALLVGAEVALRQYRKARAKLKAATRDLEAGDG